MAATWLLHVHVPSSSCVGDAVPRSEEMSECSETA